MWRKVISDGRRLDEEDGTNDTHNTKNEKKSVTEKGIIVISREICGSRERSKGHSGGNTSSDDGETNRRKFVIIR